MMGAWKGWMLLGRFCITLSPYPCTPSVSTINMLNQELQDVEPSFDLKGTIPLQNSEILSAHHGNTEER